MPLARRTFRGWEREARGVTVSTPRRVAKFVNADGPLELGEVMRVMQAPDRALPAEA